jgi:hypothetical protein
LETAPSASYLYTSPNPLQMQQKHNITGNLLVQKTGRKIALSAGLCKKKENYDIIKMLKNSTLNPAT